MKTILKSAKPSQGRASSRQLPLMSEEQFLSDHSMAVFLGSLKRGHVIGALIFALAIMFYHLFNYQVALTHAILYMFAFDGKVTGRMDGNVLMRNGRGRAFVVPALVRNSYTISARALFSQYSAGYSGLSATQIAAWKAFSMSVSNRLGQAKVIKGKACYVRLNVNLTLASGTPISTPPVLTGVIGITSVTMAVSAPSTLDLTYTPSPTNANSVHLVFATAGLPAGVLSPSKSAYRLIGTIAVAQASPQSFGSSYNTKFGNIVTGKRYFVSLTAINKTTGEAAQSVAQSAIA